MSSDDRSLHGAGVPPPSAEEQVKFLERVQRILAVGKFNSTYKFALLQALANLSVEGGHDGGGAALTVTVDELTEQFIRLYARQARPYLHGAAIDILSQNKGRQAVVVRVLSDVVTRYTTGSPSYALPAAVRSAIDETIRDQPLWKLQRVDPKTRLDFLYENTDDKNQRQITLRPGVAYCFRGFHGFITAMIQARWEQWIRERNRNYLGDVTSLRAFLFGADRQDLAPYRRFLMKREDRLCFYTGDDLTRNIAVDHFIPWSQYPTDLGHNFVLTKRGTNSSKSNFLASEPHLEKWLRRCVEHGRELEYAFHDAGLSATLEASLAIAEHAYATVESSGGNTWQGVDDFVRLGSHWRDEFRSARSALGIH